MKYWRIRMRKGNRGEDMFDKCRANGLAAIHYRPTEKIDLSKFSDEERPDEWKALESSQSGSLRDFAWQIRGGDVIVVAKSYPSRIVGYGTVRGSERNPAYRFDAQTPIVDESSTRWTHVINVAWEPVPREIRYPKPYAPQYSVLNLRDEELKKVQSLLKELPISTYISRYASSSADIEKAIRIRELQDFSYTRYTPQMLGTIDRKHVKLCNAFTAWLKRKRGVSCTVERRNIDATFNVGTRNVLVEFKVAYGLDTRPAIREAIGQILEYNHYGHRVPFDDWVLILDCEPNKLDKAFLSALRHYGLPLSFGWATAVGFSFSESSPLA